MCGKIIFDEVTTGKNKVFLMVNFPIEHVSVWMLTVVVVHAEEYLSKSRKGVFNGQNILS